MCYLLFSSIILAIVSQSYHSIAKSSFVFFRKNQSERKLNSLEHLLYQAISSNSFNQYIPTYHWHKSLPRPGYIQNALSRLSANSQPNRNSAILEIVEIVQTLLIPSKGNQSVFNGNIEINQVTNLRGIFSPEPLGSFRILGKPALKHLNSNLWELTLHTTQLNQAEIVLTSENLKLTPQPSLILPLTDHYILYTSNENILRRISLITTENQPLLENVSLIVDTEDSCLITNTDMSQNSSRTINCTNPDTTYLERLHAIDY